MQSCLQLDRGAICTLSADNVQAIVNPELYLTGSQVPTGTVLCQCRATPLCTYMPAHVMLHECGAEHWRRRKRRHSSTQGQSNRAAVQALEADGTRMGLAEAIMEPLAKVDYHLQHQYRPHQLMSEVS